MPRTGRAFPSHPLLRRGTAAVSGATLLASSDAGAGADVAALTAIEAATDAGLGSDATALLSLLGGSDVGAGSDSSFLSIPVAGSDSGLGADTIARLSLLTGADSGIGADASARLSLLTGADSGIGSDSSLVSTPVFGSDSGSGSDSAVLSSLMAALDSAIGADTSALAVRVTPSEAGAGSDASTLLVVLLGSDAATGVDSSSLSVPKAGADVGSGSDVATQLAIEPSSDVGSGADAGARTALYTGLDAGSGADTGSLGASIPTTDAGSGADSGAVSGALVSLSGQDGGVGSDIPSLIIRPVSDVGAGSDDSILQLVSNEVGVGSDSAVLAYLLSLQESGLGSELSALIANIPTILTRTNLLVNGGFENDTFGWSVGASIGGTMARDNTDAAVGSWGMKATYGTSGINQLTPSPLAVIPRVTPGIPYTLSAWHKVDPGSGCSMYLQFETANLATILSSNSIGIFDTAWTRRSLTVVAPPGAVYARLLFLYMDGGGGRLGTCRVDGIQFETGSIATPYIDTNGSSLTVVDWSEGGVGTDESRIAFSSFDSAVAAETAIIAALLVSSDLGIGVEMSHLLAPKILAMIKTGYIEGVDFGFIDGQRSGLIEESGEGYIE